MISFTLVHGPATVETGIRSINELVETIAGDRKTEAVLLGALAQLHAMAGDFDEARGLYRRGQTILAELGAGIDALTTSIDSSRVELLAGDLATAEAELRRDHDALEALGETYFRSTIAGLLAHVLLRAGRLDEASDFAATAEKISESDDLFSTVLWQTARARIRAEAGDPEAVTLAESAAALARGTADLELEADVNLREAFALYDRKGDRVSASAHRENAAATSA